MPANISPDPRTAIDTIVGQLETAWNAMDAAGFARHFAEDADFVNIRGEHHRGRTAIAAGHEAIFRTVYADSTCRFTIEATRLIRPQVALAHVHSTLDVPAGPLKGHHTARFSLVLTSRGEDWEIAAFHNTLER
jgi:uncharacterized protein (TIGR02246 family)